MPARLLVALLLLPWFAAMVEAGAWPREKGQVFLSFSSQFEERDKTGINRQSFSFYAEYGATERLTLGLDINGDALRMSKAIAFLRWSVGHTGRPLKLALELGAGQAEDAAALRPGLSIGRGFALGKRHGWLNADLRAILGGGTAFETDLTAGLAVMPRTLAVVQLQAGAPGEGRDYLRLAPSLVYEMRPGAQIELGLIQPLSGGGERGVTLGLWRRF
ncbi:hypothetical protein [Roseovarius autotrophicus]|uniref:hypothetical protein n=1 Tax=Roseovarius autotrophicus TaxID=2824121 RepID=UPI0019FDCCDA|nr:hypothetical protein [Roseovarius autotrophicus]MBE0453337.1 hypothetical protein [Roseovarius sp.]